MRKTALIIAVLAVSVPLLFGMAFGASEDDFQKAVNYYKTGSYTEAASVLREYVKERPEGRAYYLLGYANYALGKQEEAARNFQDAYLVDPEMNPQEFRKSIGIDTGIVPKPRVKKPAAVPSAPTVEAPAPAKEAPAPAKIAPAPAKEAPAPAEVKEAAPPPPAREAPAERPRRRPSPAQPAEPGPSMMPGMPFDMLLGLGLTTVIAVMAIWYILYSLCLFIIGRKTDTGASWLAFVPGINFVWPLVGASGKGKIWILITIIFSPVALYLWMCVASRFGRSKLLGLLFAFIVGVPILNILFVKLVFKEAGGLPSASMGLELPDMPEEFADLPEVPGMEGGGEEPSFEAAPAAESAEEEDFFSEGFGEEEPKEEAPPAEETEGEDIFALGEEEEPEDLGEEDAEELDALDLGEEEGGERAPTLEEMGFAEEAPEEDTFDFAEAEEATPEEAFEEEENPEDFPEGAPAGAPGPHEELEAITPEEAFERAAPHEGAEPWELPEEEPLEYESAEGEEAFLTPAPAGAGMMGIGELFSTTWGSFTSRVLPLLGLYLIAFIVTGAVAGIFIGIGALLGMFMEGMREGILYGAVVVAVVAGIIAFCWGYGAFIFAASDDRLGFGAALKRGWQKVGSFIWIMFLLNFIILGGFGLLIVPAFLFSIWFGFAIFVFAKEGVTGMDSLLKSREYVRGNFWGVLLRLFIVWIIYVGISWVPFVGGILAILYMPFMMLYIYNLYADLRRLKGDFAFSPSGGQKALYIVLAVLGFIVIPVAIFALAGAAVFAPLLMQMNM